VTVAASVASRGVGVGFFACIGTVIVFVDWIAGGVIVKAGDRAGFCIKEVQNANRPKMISPMENLVECLLFKISPIKRLKPE